MFSFTARHFGLRSTCCASGAAIAAAVSLGSQGRRELPSGALGPWRPPSRCETLVADWNDATKAAKLDVNYRAREVVEQRRAMLAVVAPQRGERVLDVGCGPGFFMRDVADLVGEEGHVEGLDPSRPLRDIASARLAGVRHSSVSAGGAEALPYADGSFDAVVFSQVLLYVEDVPLALAEAHRVLKPGGRVFILDTDWDSLIVNTADMERFERLRAACKSTFVHASLPPKIPGMLTRAGFTISKVDTVPMVAHGSTDDQSGSWIGNWVFNVVPQKAKDFGIAKADIDGWLFEQQTLCSANALFVIVHRFLFLAQKPANT